MSNPPLLQEWVSPGGEDRVLVPTDPTNGDYADLLQKAQNHIVQRYERAADRELSLFNGPSLEEFIGQFNQPNDPACRMPYVAQWSIELQEAIYEWPKNLDWEDFDYPGDLYMARVGNSIEELNYRRTTEDLCCGYHQTLIVEAGTSSGKEFSSCQGWF